MFPTGLLHMCYHLSISVIGPNACELLATLDSDMLERNVFMSSLNAQLMCSFCISTLSTMKIAGSIIDQPV